MSLHSSGIGRCGRVCRYEISTGRPPAVWSKASLPVAAVGGSFGCIFGSRHPLCEVRFAPHKRTSSACPVRSEKCQEETFDDLRNTAVSRKVASWL